MKKAQLLISINNNISLDRPQNGDVIIGFNNRRILQVHAEHICTPNTFNTHGLRFVDSISYKMNDLIHQYKFQRVSDREVLRIDRVNNKEKLFSNIPNGKEYINVDLHIKHLITSHNHLIFGNTNKEIWYGGYKNYCNEIISDIWDMIEFNTFYNRNFCTEWPFTDLEKRRFLIISVNDFSDKIRTNLSKPVYNYNNPEHFINNEGYLVVKYPIELYRKYYINWELLDLGVDHNDILNNDLVTLPNQNVLYDLNSILIEKDLVLKDVS